RVLFGQRKLEKSQFEWQLPGGWIRNGESPDEAARREVEEETGLQLDKLYLVAVTNNVFSVQNHSISLCFEAKCLDPNQLSTREPNKCQGWFWKYWREMDRNMFLPLEKLKKSDYLPFFENKYEKKLSF
ncbi:MAG: NUDIX domain-containing protein, partial [Gammaproteobacteria bacterium]|nr:NUDIX domain-containing protein [Gammaproteobacteria bacterium]